MGSQWWKAYLLNRWVLLGPSQPHFKSLPWPVHPASLPLCFSLTLCLMLPQQSLFLSCGHSFTWCCCWWWLFFGDAFQSGNYGATFGILKGLITRSQLIVLLKNKVGDHWHPAGCACHYSCHLTMYMQWVVDRTSYHFRHSTRQTAQADPFHNSDWGILERFIQGSLT